MKKIIFQVKTNNVITETVSAIDTTSFSIWFWIALIEFVIIVFLFFRLRKKGKKLTFGDLSKDKIRSAKKSNVDMENLMNSINGSQELYKQLSRTCHPDRFINNNKQELAEEIFQEITKHKRDFNKLTELKEKAITELDIKFN